MTIHKGGQQVKSSMRKTIKHQGESASLPHRQVLDYKQLVGSTIKHFDNLFAFSLFTRCHI